MAEERRMVNTSSDSERREDWFTDSLLSGFVATIGLTVALGAAYGVASWLGDATGNQLERWLYGLSHNRITERADDSLVLAIGLNLLAGLVFAVVYGLIEHRIPLRRGWQKGMAFSLLLFLLSITVFFPIMGVGLFGSDLDAGPLAILGNLVLHLIYGASLGAVYAVDLDAWLDDTLEDHVSALAMQRSTSYGILFGAVAGAFIGFAVRDQFEGVIMNDLSIVLGALVGASFGGLIGSMMTPELNEDEIRR